MTLDEVTAASRPYPGRKYENMTVLQRLRCDLMAEAGDYDHTMMHAHTPHQERQARKHIGDELVEIAQNYAWRYAKHKQLQLLDVLIAAAKDGRIVTKATLLELMLKWDESIKSDLTEYQQQFKNMELM